MEWHNEALQLLDCIVAGSIEEPARNDPPLSPTLGQTFLVGSAPTDDWSQFPEHLAAFGAGGWRFVPPFVGLAVIDKSTGTATAYGPAGWEAGVVRASRIVVDGRQVVAAQAAAIADPTGGATADAEARSTITEILSAMRQHGLICS